MLTPFFIFIGIDALFIVLGIIFFSGKGSALIAGYNTASPAERAKYNEKALCKAMGWLMFALAACWFVASLNFLLENTTFLWIGQGAFFLAVIVGIVYINTSKKIKRG